MGRNEKRGKWEVGGREAREAKDEFSGRGAVGMIALENHLSRAQRSPLWEKLCLSVSLNSKLFLRFSVTIPQ